jgi:hypothetical protein
MTWIRQVQGLNSKHQCLGYMLFLDFYVGWTRSILVCALFVWLVYMQFHIFWSIPDKLGGGHHPLKPLNIQSFSHNFVVVHHTWLLLAFIFYLIFNSLLIVHVLPTSYMFALCFVCNHKNVCIILDHPKVQINQNSKATLLRWKCY